MAWLAWAINKQYIDDMIAAGKKIVVTLGEEKKIGKGLEEEIKYLDDLIDAGVLDYLDGTYIPR